MTRNRAEERGWFWATLMLSSLSIIAAVFGVWELVQNHFTRELNYATLHYLYVTRGILSSLLIAAWAGWFVVRQRRRSEGELRRSREHYRGLMNASPSAVALFDAGLRVSEWNATAERLYGLQKAEAAGRALPTLPPEKANELAGFMRQVDLGRAILDVETVRRHKDGSDIDVQLSLLPYRESGGAKCYLEVTTDIRDRVRLRRSLLELEKLTSMGKMAAGAAHHLNTPLAAMLLRVQMMRQRHSVEPSDLERLESSIRFCKHFVQRLLDFSRRAPARKQPEELEGVIQSVAAFLAPAALAKGVEISTESAGVNNARVLADRNLLEALLTILVGNSIDAAGQGGRIRIEALPPESDEVEIRVIDNGCGIPAANLARVFEPFFTTKSPGEGTGLGLAIAQNIVLEHGGSLRLESAEGQGATAFVRLPFCKASEAAGGSSQ